MALDLSAALEKGGSGLTLGQGQQALRVGSRPRLNHNEKVIKIVIGSGQGATS